MPSPTDVQYFVDATTAITWGPNVPSGIPRLEGAIVRQVLKDREARISLFLFDHQIGRCRTLSVEEETFVEAALSGEQMSLDKAASMTFWQRCRFVSGLWSRPLLVRRESHRAIAQFLCNRPERRGFGYMIAKTGIRILAYLTPAKQARSEGDGDRPDPMLLPNARCFLPITTAQHLMKKYEPADIQCSVVTLIHDTLAIDLPAFGSAPPEKFKSALKFAIEISDTIVSVSRTTEQRVVAWAAKLEIDCRQKSFFVVEPASAEFLDRQQSPVALLADGRRYVLFCSTIEPRKNHLTLFKAMKLLADEDGSAPFVLVCVGRWGWKFAATRQYLKDNPELRHSVMILPAVSDAALAWLYANALFTVFPSFGEGWGFGAQESLIAGVPVIISNIGSLTEVTRGLMPIVDAADPAAWASIMKRYANEPESLAALRRRIATGYVRRTEAQMYRALVQILVGQAEDGSSSAGTEWRSVAQR